MASSKERLRWERWYDDVHARMERQKASIVRLVAINTEAMAALEEIAAADPQGDEWDDADAFRAGQERAQEALDRIKGSAAATVLDAPDSTEETPIEDPRRSHG